MPRTVTTFTRRWEDSDSFQADPETPDSVDSEVAECVTDDWSPAVIEAVELLRANGCTAPNCSPGFFEDMWYTEVDGGSTVNYRTGAHHELSAHLAGFTVGEQRQIWQLVTGELSVLEANVDRA